MLTLSHEDHVWNEFYAGPGQWLPYDTGWSDTPMRVGDWGVSGDGDSGGGKENAVILGWRGDGQMINLLGRYQSQFVDEKIDYEYTRHLDLSVRVLDGAKQPVDGALVTLMTEYFYSSAMAVRALFATTGRDGVAHLRVGDNRNYYINIASPLGHYPAQMDLQSYFVSPMEFKPLLTKEQAVAGIAVEKEFVLQGQDSAGNPYGKLEYPQVNEEPPAPSPTGAPYHQIRVDLTPLAEHRPGLNPLNGRHFFETSQPGLVDLYVMDRANYQLFAEGGACTAALVREGVEASAQIAVDLPDSSAEWVVTLSNRRRVKLDQLVRVKLDLMEVSPVTPPPPDLGDGGDSGCSCRVGGSAGSPLDRRPTGMLVWAAAALLFFGLRKGPRRR
jgi:hypothetical protein